MLKNDRWIIEQAENGMISPFIPAQVRQWEGIPVISYGVSSYGCDIRLSPSEFLVFKRIPGAIVDPKAFNPNNLEQAELHHDESGSYFILPANSYGLGVSLETIAMPPNVTAICMGKSTYARVGIIANTTPLEAKWFGHITLEFSNSSSSDCRIYANEGVVQLLFLEGEPCITTYNDRFGKYQGQNDRVTLAKV